MPEVPIVDWSVVVVVELVELLRVVSERVVDPELYVPLPDVPVVLPVVLLPVGLLDVLLFVVPVVLLLEPVEPDMPEREFVVPVVALPGVVLLPVD